MSNTERIPGGGCWFCNCSGGDDFVFSLEFDCPVHLSCIREAHEQRPDDPEVIVFRLEFTELLEKDSDE